MTTYASIKGSAAAPVPKVSRREPLPALSATEAAHVEANRQFVLEHMPELLPLIRALHAEGLIDGWRSVRNCTLKDTE